MAKLPGIQRISKEDFPQDQQDLVGKMAQPINQGFEVLSAALNKALTLEDNFSASVKSVDVVVDATGRPRTNTTLRSDIKGLTRGLSIIRADNVTNAAGYPTTAPFISFNENAGMLVINNVTGLLPDQKYRLRVIVWG